MADVKLIVLIDSDKKQLIENIADQLSKVGMQIDQKLSITGIISGGATIDKIDALRSVQGVAELRIEEKFSVPRSQKPTR